jgi:multidrug efflux pump subunit AcrB
LSSFKIILSFIILAVLGFIFVPRLSIDLLPNKSLPVLTISFTLNDAPPEVVEQEATAPLENVLSQLAQIKKN